MLKMDERTLLREAKEISLEKLQQAIRQVRPSGGPGLGLCPRRRRRASWPPALRRELLRPWGPQGCWQVTRVARGLQCVLDPEAETPTACPSPGTQHQGRCGQGTCVWAGGLRAGGSVGPWVCLRPEPVWWTRPQAACRTPAPARLTRPPTPQNGVASGLMQMLLLKVSAHITEQLGVAPGGEFREAFKEVGPGPTGGWGSGAAPGSPTDTPTSHLHPGQQGAVLQVPPGRPAHPRHLQAGHRRPLPVAEGQVGLGPVLPVGPHQVGPIGLPAGEAAGCDPQ